MQVVFCPQHQTQDRGPDVDMRNFSVFKHGKIPSTQRYGQMASAVFL
jgi:hypothetical protein